MNSVNLTINGKQVTVPAGSTILDAARKLNINIPTLCYCDKLGCGVSNKPASCRICVVEVERRRNLAPACATPVMEGMVVLTNSQRALNARRTVLELMLSDHPQQCLTCAKSQDCELRMLAAEFGIQDIAFSGAKAKRSCVIFPNVSCAAVAKRFATVFRPSAL